MVDNCILSNTVEKEARYLQSGFSGCPVSQVSSVLVYHPPEGCFSLNLQIWLASIVSVVSVVSVAQM